MTDYETALREFIREEILHGRSAALDAEQDLLGAGIIDSLGILRLVAFIEERFGVKVADEDVVFENFESIGTMARYVEHKAAAQPPAAV